MRIAKDQKEKYDKEMAEKMEIAKKAQAEREAAEAAARAEAQAAKKAAAEAKAAAKAAAKNAARSKRAAPKTKKKEAGVGAKHDTEGGVAFETGAKGKVEEAVVAGVEVKAGTAAEGATGDKQEEDEYDSYEDSDIENEGHESDGGTEEEAGGGEKGKGDDEDGRGNSLVPDTEIGKKVKCCESCHTRLNQSHLYHSFKMYNSMLQNIK